MISQNGIQCEKAVENAGRSSVGPAWFERLMSQQGGDLTDIFRNSPSSTTIESSDTVIRKGGEGYTIGSESPAVRLIVPHTELGKRYLEPVKVVERKCRTCGRVFQSKIWNQVHCPSHTGPVRQKERKNAWKISRNCKCCGNPFIPNTHNQIYCKSHLFSKTYNRWKHGQEAIVPSSLKGAMSELLVSCDLMARGFQVFRNLSPHGIDLIAYGGNGQFLRIEATTGSMLSDGRISASDHKKTRDKWDILAISLPDNTVAYRKDDLLTPVDPMLDALHSD